MTKRSWFTRLHVLVALVLPLAAIAQQGPRPADGKLKIFILSGQSNMVGFGQLEGSPGTMATYVESKPDDYGHLVNDDGTHVVRDDVWIVNLSHEGEEQQGWLTTGYGSSAGHIGPEYGFGFAVGDYFDDPVLIIKSAWGGRSLVHNFLSPSSEDYPTPEKDGDKGFQYAEVLRHVKAITGDLKKYFPDDFGGGYEIVGFGWHQGWNDRINQAAVDVYEGNMVNFVQDIRKDLKLDRLPVVIANTGMGGWEIPIRYKAKVEKLMEAQLALADAERYPDFAGNVAGVETRDFQRTREESPSKQDYHWMRNWETYYLIGKSMGDAMVGLIDAPEVLPPPRTEYMGRTIARTMHWRGAEWLLRETREKEEHATRLLEALSIEPGQTVCDLGCGNGFHTLPIAAMVGEGGRVLAVDIQEQMLGLLERRLRKRGIENVEKILCGVADPNLPPASCDLILLVDVYHEISYPQRVLRHLRAALKPGGRIALVEFRTEDPEVPIKPLHKMSKAQMRAELAANGFVVVEEFDGLPWQHVMFFGRAD